MGKTLNVACVVCNRGYRVTNEAIVGDATRPLFDIAWQTISFAFVVREGRRGVVADIDRVTEIGDRNTDTGSILDPG